MIISQSGQLPRLLNLVHDCWFDVERVALDRQHNEVAIHFEPQRSYLDAGSKQAIAMVISHAVSLSINDTERVQVYDLNEITYDAPGRRLVITCGIPLTIEVEVTSLHIEVTTDRTAVIPQPEG